MKIFDGPLHHLELALDIRQQKHGVLQGNLANIDTPGYRPVDVDFDASLRAALDADARSGDTSDVIVQTESMTLGANLDGNGVDADRTMAALAENSLQYGAAARAAGKHLALLRLVANEGVG